MNMSLVSLCSFSDMNEDDDATDGDSEADEADGEEAEYLGWAFIQSEMITD